MLTVGWRFHDVKLCRYRDADKVRMSDSYNMQIARLRFRATYRLPVTNGFRRTAAAGGVGRRGMGWNR